MNRLPFQSALLLPAISGVLAAPALAQDPPAPTVLPGVTVTATRVERESFDLPVSIDTVGARTIREGRPQVNLSESLNAVPGIVVQNRQNYAQDLQISSRGFGARSTFGVRGIRLIADGIPATMPDGQGQAASFNLDTAERIEVLRGPFASMYGNASGGVIQIFTADGPPQPTLGLRLYGGSYDTTKWVAHYGGQHGPLNANVSHSVFRTDGYREHSAARRDHTHGKFKIDGGAAGTFTLVADRLDQPETQDPLGLTAAQVASNRRQAPAVAFQFNTRKSISQGQLGLYTISKSTLATPCKPGFTRATGRSRNTFRFRSPRRLRPPLRAASLISIAVTAAPACAGVIRTKRREDRSTYTSGSITSACPSGGAASSIIWASPAL